MVITNGMSVAATRASSGQAWMRLDVSVNDAQVRQQVDGFDGLERPFALIPYQHGASAPVEWRRVDLGYETTEFDAKTHSLTDDYGLSGVDQKDCVADKLGVVVGMDTNEGTLWAQDYGQTIPVREPGSSR